MSTTNLIVERVKLMFPALVDLRTLHLRNLSFEIDILYLSTLVDINVINKYVSVPFNNSHAFDYFEAQLFSFGAEVVADTEDIRKRLLLGHTCIIYYDKIYSISAKRSLNDQPGENKTENTILGPSKSFSEDLHTNMGLIRSRYKRASLSSEALTVGHWSKTEIILMYDATHTKPELLEQVRSKLLAIDVDLVQASGQLERLLNDTRFSLFPRMMITERPDRTVLNLAQGKIVILMEGTAYALAVPCVFFDFMSAMDDLYQSFWITKALVILRYISLLITVTLPAFYVAIVSYNPEILRVQLTLSIAGSRAAVPYPSYIEVFIMLFMIEALIEASLRLPKYIGSTATTVGGLILGQAAQQAGLVSSIMIIITSAVAISNFVIPINAMSFAMRFVKFVLIVFAALFGVVGIVVGMFLLVNYLASLRSFGEPYLKIYMREKKASYSIKEGDPM
ncbi:spore germination protein [Paenibacillus sp. GCM10023248]|uniref:spore germination protein n=1 Tax=unclassified Paenibacillus TaxID=185978 RepID=UPI002377E539|nr:spore germination protein [Paenibacillus sp. MAHUQ-63]MDD9268457.1 spore germination protein [Paenibacillus sp. MAHUQ-63]